jgi:hypothetical protein
MLACASHLKLSCFLLCLSLHACAGLCGVIEAKASSPLEQEAQNVGNHRHRHHNQAATSAKHTNKDKI